MNRKRIMVLVGGLTSIIFLYFALRGQDWAEIVDAFQKANYLWLIPAGCLILADYVFRAWRWGVILKPAARRQLPMSMLFPVLLLGFAANNVFPARAGEVWRMWGLTNRTHVRKTVALSTLIVERVFDVLTLLFLLAIASIVYPLPEHIKGIQYLLSGLFMFVLIGLLLIIFFEQWTLRITTRLIQPLPVSLRERLQGMIGSFAKGLHALKEPRALAGIVGSSLLAWGSQAFSFTAILLAFGLTYLPAAQLFGASILMLALINILIMIPAGPGNVGTFEVAGKEALMITAIATPEQAIAIVLVTHMLQWLLVTGLGVLIAVQQGITLTRLGTAPELTEG
ncbi:MAG: lysylphosphatidylglycerol synthase transmembrane domain-containing protein [Ardenticatenaceae bacterium]